MNISVATLTTESLLFNSLRSSASFLISFGLGLTLFLFLAGRIYFWEPGGIELLPSGSYGVLLASIFTALGLAAWRSSGQKFEINLVAVAAVLVVLFFTDWICRGYSMLQGPTIRGEIFALGVLSIPLIFSNKLSLLRIVAIIGPLLYLWCFLETSHGRLLVSDDHAANFYRVWLLNEHFPFVPHYYPFWNTGTEARDYFPSGIFNFYFLFFPFIKLLNLNDIYTSLVAVAVFVLAPLSIYLAARVIKLRAPVPEIAAILGGACSLLWYRWALKYGSMGFVTSMVCLPVAFALCVKILSKDQEFKWYEAILFVFTITLTVIWSLAAVIFAPVYLAGILLLRRVLRKRFAIAIIIALLCCNLPWIVTFITVSNPGKFVNLESYQAVHNRNEGLELSQLERDLNDPWSGQMEVVAIKGVQREVSLRSALHTLREALHSTNPLLILFALPGLLLLQPGLVRRLFSATAVWLIFLGSFVSALKPQLELDRMFIAAALILTLPAALALANLFESARRGVALIFSAFTCGILLSGIFAVTTVAQNRSFERFTFANGTVKSMSDAIVQYSGPGRVVFLGFILHELSGMHIAPLTLFTGKPIVASNPFHQIWQYSELVPDAYLNRGEQGIEEFLDIKNGTSVIAHEKKWIDYLEARPERYELVWHRESFSMYRRIGAVSNYFLEGQAELVLQDSSSVIIRPHTENLVLKFQYFPFLKTSACQISGKKLPGDMTVIALSKCPVGTDVKIEMQTALARIL